MPKARLTSTYVASEIKLGAHHLAYLRAIAEGLGREVAAQRYLGHDVRDGAVALRRQHQAIVDQVRALARRQGERRWRLVGLEIRPVRAGEVVPTADEWASAQGLDEFSQAEVLALHAEAFPTLRQDVRNGRLRGQQLDLLLRLSTSSVGAALPHHRLDDWLAPNLSRRLMASGLLLLSDLVARVQMGGRWWSASTRHWGAQSGPIGPVAGGLAARIDSQQPQSTCGCTRPGFRKGVGARSAG